MKNLLICSFSLAVGFALAGEQHSPAGAPPGANLALVATTSTSFVSGHETITALNDGLTPRDSNDKRNGAYGNWPQRGTQWVQYDWSLPVAIRQMDVYWFDDHGGVRLPKACRLQYWDGSGFADVPGASGLGLAEHCFNSTIFPEITTTRLRLEFDGTGDSSTGILEWRVYDTGKSPNFPPTVSAGVDRAVVQPGETWLSGRVKDDGKPKPAPTVQWSKASGPGQVSFGNVSASETTARFSAAGDYILKLTADDGQSSASGEVQVTVVAKPSAPPLSPVWTTPYQVSSPFWRPRLRNLIVNWIPHCVRQCEDPEVKEGGIENFVQAAKKLAGQPGARHTGAVFANTWVYNTLESLCLAQMLDPQGDAAMAAAQDRQRKTIEDWVAKILAAQEPDGYLLTQYTIQGQRRWSNKHDHEDFQAGHFIEAAIAHHLMSGGKDARMLDAAKRLADCWVRAIGPPPKRAWYPGHQEMETALVKLARYVEPTDGSGTGRAYIELAKFLLDSRNDGDEYDQSHAPVIRQYEAVGHAVRALYSYAGMADVAMETGDTDYQSAVQSLWNSVVNKKYYVTGGIGSGETSEGFGKEFSLPNHAYCESCANCGQLHFQTKLQMIWRDGCHADLAEETLFNAILGGVDLDARNYTYTNPLDSSAKRYTWHVCPCCVGIIPRTLLSLPTWMYTKSRDAIWVNQFAGSAVTVDKIAGTSVKLTQATDYPWSGKVALDVNPAAAVAFTLNIRVPDRQTSLLYTNTPRVGGLLSLAVNGKPVKPKIERGYAILDRTWKAGDKVEWEVPLAVQRVVADHRIVADRGRVALRHGPLIYNIESVDQDVNAVLPSSAPLTTEWRPDLLGGVLVIQGQFADGKPLLAIPNYARLNRGGRSVVWMKDR
ncbi:MAG TPA: glycoside hydrolase family 127 protein [Verrucomicrobiota bacterium]|nr:glycoside hydrolase family 127 protein [Verrucomicrobiota bacterium]HNU52371.1 glycoside hydrolase family 127 protein [Verrucomicrobiota bacterium]